jgi:hypothetical protein
VGWRTERIDRGVGPATGGLFRLAATLREGEAEYEQTVVLKVVSPAAWRRMVTDPDDPALHRHPLYWKREALAYQSGWLEQLPGGLRAPRCLAADEQQDSTVWLWLEDVRDQFPAEWTAAHYARAARCLGRFNWAYVAGQVEASESVSKMAGPRRRRSETAPEGPLADRPPARMDWPHFAWLARVGSPRGVIEAYAWLEGVVRNPATWDHPLLRPSFPPALHRRLPEFWEARHGLLNMLERLPQTVCHQDAWPDNAYFPSDSAQALGLLDWASAGWTVVGSDLADLAVAGYPLLRVRLTPAEIDEAVFEPYLEGLREAGWAVERDLVRFAYITCAALKYGCLLIWLRDLDNEMRLNFLAGLAGKPTAAWLERQTVVLEHQLQLLGEAKQLATYRLLPS